MAAPLSVDIRTVSKARVVPWEHGEYQYGVEYTTLDGHTGADPIGTLEQAETIVRIVDGQKSSVSTELIPKASPLRKKLVN